MNTHTATINNVSVTVYSDPRFVTAYALPGHVTGWLRREGARTTYAELTCTCHLTAEPIAPEGEGTWISLGSDGWIDRLNALALAHVENVTRNGYMVRPARGDRSRWADRTRVDEMGLREAMQRAGLRYSELLDHIADVKAGRIVTAEDGTRFELAADRSPYTREPLPLS